VENLNVCCCCSANLFKVKSGLTQRAADLGYVPHYFGIFLAGSLSRFEGESTIPPQAANASRWLADARKIEKGKLKYEQRQIDSQRFSKNG
jgi:hypothetical protein